MPKIYTLLFLFIALGSYAQDKASIRHYQKKWKTDSIHLPCQKWDSRDLLIHVPDSIYDSGSVQVKKLTLKGSKGFSCEVKIVDDDVYSTVIKAKGKKNRAILLQLEFWIQIQNKKTADCKVATLLKVSKRNTALQLNQDIQGL
ncbi:hypothetical protein OAD66_01865 [Bacteroidia bacterium]|nr:hypothetical protein [Bacteroidia bacterium]MDB9881859.1 hypothetical protein [Bacteroidia bacterium]